MVLGRRCVAVSRWAGTPLGSPLISELNNPRGLATGAWQAARRDHLDGYIDAEDCERSGHLGRQLGPGDGGETAPRLEMNCRELALWTQVKLVVHPRIRE